MCWKKLEPIFFFCNPNAPPATALRRPCPAHGRDSACRASCANELPAKRWRSEAVIINPPSVRLRLALKLQYHIASYEYFASLSVLPSFREERSVLHLPLLKPRPCARRTLFETAPGAGWAGGVPAPARALISLMVSSFSFRSASR